MVNHHNGRLLRTILGLSLSLFLTTSAMAAPVSAVAPTPDEGLNQRVSTPVAMQSQVASELTKISQEEAIEIARETFQIPPEFGSPSVYYYSSEKPTRVQTYHLNWSSPNRLSSIREHYNAEVDASSGFIRSFNHYFYDPAHLGDLPKYRREEAFPIAQSWLNRILPEQASDMRLDETLADELHDQGILSFRWYRVVNGIVFPNDYVMITINPQDGSLENYLCNWTHGAVMPSPEGVIDRAAAQAVYDREFLANLVFQRFYQPIGQSLLRLVYQVEPMLVDAQSGELLNSEGQKWKPAQPVPLPGSDQQLVKLPTPMGEAEALAVARGLLGDVIASNPESASLNQEANPISPSGRTGEVHSVWYFGWTLRESETNPYSFIHVAVDADYGVVCGFSRDGIWKPDEKFEGLTPVDETVARQKAVDFLAQVRPDLLSQVRLLDRSVFWSGPMGSGEDAPIQREYSFNFERVAHGIPISGDYVNIAIDRFTSDVRSFWISWSEATPESPNMQELKPVAEIQSLMAEQIPLEPQYRSLWNQETMSYETKLVYAPIVGATILFDAVSGHRLDWSGRDLTEARNPIADIADHPYRGEIEIMIYRQVFEAAQGEFRPEGTMNRGEVAKALVTAFGQGDIAQKFAMETIRAHQAPSYSDVDYDNPFYAYIEQAVRSGIFQPTQADDHFGVDTVVTNEEFAHLVARAMDYGEIAKMKPAIEVSYADCEQISTTNRNAVGILIGLEVLSGQGEFKPTAPLKRADAAHMLYVATQKTPRSRIYY